MRPIIQKNAIWLPEGTKSKDTSEIHKVSLTLQALRQCRPQSTKFTNPVLQNIEVVFNPCVDWRGVPWRCNLSSDLTTDVVLLSGCRAIGMAAITKPSFNKFWNKWTRHLVLSSFRKGSRTDGELWDSYTTVCANLNCS